MKKEAKHLYKKAIDSLTLSVEIFNRPNDCGRIPGVLIFMDHAFEMLLKASIIAKGGRIKETGAKETIGFSACIRKGFSDASLKFLNEEEVLTLQSLNGLRDAAQHYTLEMSEQHIYFQAQAGLTLFRDITRRVFNINLKTQLPVRVLPLSTSPPMDIQAFFASEITDIKKLLIPNSRKKLEANEKLRALAIMENSIQGNESQPSDKELNNLAEKLSKGSTWVQLFPSVSTLSFTQNGYGPSLDLRISKNEGVPITIVPEGTLGSNVLAIKRVNELDFYNLGRDAIAKKLNHTGPKITAAVQIFNIKNDPECFKQIKIGNSLFDRYSQKTIEKIREGLKEKTIDEIWMEYRTK
ncbi:DUF3644 domain-containing protein [Flavobacterium aquidurense]|uniref:DUF3644 domain-containing protein n=1 Tax=Flavobacterium aquidurense TaxID=362413 RepID=UPI002855EDCA|nr:DUF3644 domain-containing protein [Flavobacterium aquidurense]MDR7371764.1 hypothetical protein [Flavobacterium aquidurense]